MRLKLQPQVTALFKFSDSYWGEEGVRGGEVKCKILTSLSV